ncbi:MAG: hypothetical protein CMF61_00085 [Magnetococcales bacterium]|nr:hypothetical protein [Magnetococcales bacterium]PPR19021.1 MAG: hypothetical protein CFH43_00363 [Pseudomonadota bacterium]
MHMLAVLIMFGFVAIFMWFQIQENTKEYYDNLRREKEMKLAEDERLERVRKRNILYKNLMNVRVNPEKDYPSELTDRSVILFLAQKRLQKSECQSSFDMRWLPVIRGYIEYKDVLNPTKTSKKLLERALLDYKETSFSYNSIQWALNGYP